MRLALNMRNKFSIMELNLKLIHSVIFNLSIYIVLCKKFHHVLNSQVTLTKKSIKHDLPIQLGYFVYQYAKLRMLSFYYDIIDRFVDRSDFCLLEMDTGIFITLIEIVIMNEKSNIA
jgi:hypothetical protein